MRTPSAEPLPHDLAGALAVHANPMKTSAKSELTCADLHTALARLSDELLCASDLEGTSPAYFQSRLLPILATLADVTLAASVALEPALQEAAHRAIAADVYRANVQAGEV